MTTYRVIIAGVKPGEDREAALLHLSATFKQPVERLRALVASSHAVVKRGADLALASKMSAAIEAAGFDCVIEPEPAEPTVMTSPPPAARTASSPPPADASVAPPRAAAREPSNADSHQRAEQEVIAGLTVSEKWKRRFEALSRAGTLSFWGVHSNAAALTKAERQDLSFDTLAFLFGPLAYWGRQMWLRGTLIFAFSVPLYLAAFVLQSTLGWNHNYLSWGVSIAVGAWCATHLYYDYYRQTVHGERVWSWAERWKWPVLGLGTACIAVLIAMVVIYGPSPLPGCNDSESLATVERLINDLPVVKARGIRFVSLKTVQEQGQNRSEGIRVCTATLVTTAGEDALRYQIKWTDRWKQQFLILAQVNPDEGGSSTDSTVDGDMVATFTNAYAMAKRNGDVLNACVNAGLLATVFMQGNDEPNYRKWKQIQDECQRSMTR